MKIIINDFDIYSFDDLDDEDKLVIEREETVEAQELENLIVAVAKDFQVIPQDLEVNVDNEIAWDWLCSIYELICSSGDTISKKDLIYAIKVKSYSLNPEVKKESWCMNFVKSLFN